MSPLSNIYSVLFATLILSALSAPQCTDINAEFPIKMDNTVCKGLYNVASAASLSECQQACCALQGCEVYQWCESSSDGCGAAKKCWIGGRDYCPYSPGWQSRARVEPPTSHLWPLPYQYTFSDFADIYIDSTTFNFSLGPNAVTSDIMHKAIERYAHLTFPHIPEGSPPNAVTALNQLQITVSNASEATLQYGMDESYSLNMHSDTGAAMLKSETIWGALRGLETFSQLVIFNFTDRYYTTFETAISDQPRFSHRGILMDTARHFQTVQALKDLISSMAYSKLNVLHWHISDSEGFTMQSKAYPKLWDGVLSFYERYTQNEVREVVKHAKYRGIRVVPEFDVPGHAQSWCKGYPQICPSQSCNTPLNPASNLTWQVLEGLLTKDVPTLFFDNYVHLGGDEVNTNCWTKTQSIVDWMNANKYTPFDALRYFDERAQSIVSGIKKQVINWVEVYSLFNATLDRDYVTIQVWKAKSALQSVVNNGFRAIISDSDLWYLDHLETTWESMYMNEPFANIENSTAQALIIGGEACMWGETVDVSDLQNTVWPRAAAVAERLWSPQSVNSTQSALPRISYFRCLLNERGIAAAVINNPSARAAPPQPGSCYALYDRRRRLTNS